MYLKNAKIYYTSNNIKNYLYIYKISSWNVNKYTLNIINHKTFLHNCQIILRDKRLMFDNFTLKLRVNVFA